MNGWNRLFVIFAVVVLAVNLPDGQIYESAKVLGWAYFLGYSAAWIRSGFARRRT